MDNKQLFINGYLDRIGAKFKVDKDTAFAIFSIAVVVDKTFQEVYDNIIIKGSEDGGVDGAVFIEQGGFYLFFVFQCKNSKGLKQNILEKFRHDVDNTFIKGINRPNTKDLQPKIDEYKQLSTNGYIVEMRRYFLYAGDNADPDNAANQQLYKTFHAPDDFEIWDSETLYGKISQLIKAQNRRKDIRFVFHPQLSNITLSDNQGLYTYAIGNVRAANFRIEAHELCMLVEQEINNNNTYEFLFSDNIRGFLGLRIRPNRRMQETLMGDQSIFFPLLNNGITIICERLELPSTPQGGMYILPTHNPVIVNGLQTTRVIYEVYSLGKERGEDYLRNVFVNIRLYETNNTEVVDLITDATNTQTPINYRDKVSNKDFSTLVKEVFANKNITYISKRGEVFSNPGSRMLNDAIDSDTLLKFWYASFYEQPETAKNSINEVLEKIFDATNNDHPLSKLFSGDVNSPIYQQLLYTYTIYRFVQTMRTQADSQKEFVNHANELLAYGIYKRLETDLSQINDMDKLKVAYQTAFNTIDQIVQSEIETRQKGNQAFSFNSYFKGSKCRVDYNRMVGILENDQLITDLLSKR